MTNQDIIDTLLTGNPDIDLRDNVNTTIALAMRDAGVPIKEAQVMRDESGFWASATTEEAAGKVLEWVTQNGFPRSRMLVPVDGDDEYVVACR